MALNFNAAPYLELFRMKQAQEEQNRPDINRDVTQPLMQGLNMMVQNKRQNSLMDLEKQKAGREQQMFDYEYGKPSSVSDQYSQGSRPMGLFQPGMPMVDAFKKWKGGGDLGQMGTVPGDIGAKRRAEMREQTKMERDYGLDKMKTMAQMSRYGNEASMDELDRRYKQSQIEKNYHDMEKGPKKKQEAQSRVTGNLQDMKSLYEELSEMKAIPDVEGGALSNVQKSVRSSGIGQAIGRIFGTEEQSVRNKINQMRPLLMNEIRQASEMGARGLDSEKELEFYLQAATDPARDIDSNLAAIKVLDRAYGLGGMSVDRDMSSQEKQLKNEFKSANQSGQTSVQPITQRNKRTDQIRISYDGGRTWQMQ